MIVEELFDLRIAHFQHDELTPEDISTLSEFDIIRIHEPTVGEREKFLPLGFVYKPAWLFWIRPVGNTVDDYILSLGRYAREHTRQAIKQVRRLCDTRVDPRLDLEVFDTWLALYKRRIAELPHGVDYASEDRDEFLLEPDRYAGVFVFHEQRLIAGLICLKVPDLSMLRGVYYASDSSFHHLDLTRYIYFMMVDIAREGGYQLVSTGADPNFYGYEISTGLYLFKKRMGFQAVPRGKYEPPGEDVLERVISLRKCADLCFCLGYGDSNLGSDQLVGHVYTRRPDPDISSFHASFLQRLYCHSVAGSGIM